MDIKVGLLLSAILTSILYYDQTNYVSEKELWFIRSLIGKVENDSLAFPEERGLYLSYMRNDKELSRWEYNDVLSRIVEKTEQH